MWQSPHEGYSIRPGFIYDWGLKKWSLPLKHSIQFWNQIYPAIQRSVNVHHNERQAQALCLRSFLNNFSKHLQQIFIISLSQLS